MCSEFAECANTAGSYECVCMPGYTGNGENCTGKTYLLGEIRE